MLTRKVPGEGPEASGASAMLPQRQRLLLIAPLVSVIPVVVAILVLGSAQRTEVVAYVS